MKKLPQLNLPPKEFRITLQNGKRVIWDLIRKKYVILSPEEWVRQNIIVYLIEELDYPKSLFKIESGLSYHRKQKRSDIVVCSSDGSPFLLVECKAPSIHINQKVIDQAAVYNKSIQAEFIAISNGINHYVWLLNKLTNTYTQERSFPTFQR